MKYFDLGMMGVGKKKSFFMGKVLLAKHWDQSARRGGASCAFACVVPWWVLSLQSLNGNPGFQLPCLWSQSRGCILPGKWGYNFRMQIASAAIPNSLRVL